MRLSYSSIGYNIVLLGTLSFAGWIAYLVHGVVSRKLLKPYDDPIAGTYYAPARAKLLPPLAAIGAFLAVVALSFWFEVHAIHGDVPNDNPNTVSEHDPPTD